MAYKDANTPAEYLNEQVMDARKNVERLELAMWVLINVFKFDNVSMRVPGWNVNVSSYRRYNWTTQEYNGPVTLTITYELETDEVYNPITHQYEQPPKRSWRQIAQEIVKIRKLYSIGALKRDVQADTYVRNTYRASRTNEDTGDVFKLEIVTGDTLPGTCQMVEDGVEIVPATTRTKYKVVCK